MPITEASRRWILEISFPTTLQGPFAGAPLSNFQPLRLSVNPLSGLISLLIGLIGFVLIKAQFLPVVKSASRAYFGEKHGFWKQLAKIPACHSVGRGFICLAVIFYSADTPV